MGYDNLTVIIPTFNEEKNIGKLIETLNSLYPKVSIIVADDGSKDRTQEVVKKANSKNKKTLLLDRSKCRIHGLTISAVDAILITKTPYFVVIDADFQHPPEKVKEMLDSLIQGNDVVVGIRKKIKEKWPISRKIISKTAITLGQTRLILGRNPFVRDIVSGFFGSRTQLFNNYAKKYPYKFEPEGYKILFDFLKMLPKKTKVGNVYYEFGLRFAGDSKISKKHIILFLKSIFK